MEKNLYFETSEANNLDSLKADVDPTMATPANVKNDYGFKDAQTNEFQIGTMPINDSEYIKIDPKNDDNPDNNSYTIPKGYHSGTGKVYTSNLEEYTRGTATEEDVAYNKTFWVNGEKKVGSLDVDASEQDADATAEDIVEGKTAWVKRHKLTGLIPKLFRRDKTLIAGESYTIPYGLHPGTSIISSATLEAQTPGTAAAEDIKEGLVAWVNGEKLVGTFNSHDEIVEALKETDSNRNQVLEGTKFYSNTYKQIVSGTMPDHTGEPTRIVNIGELFTIPEGYYDGSTSIRTKSLFDMTQGSATKTQILDGRVAWVNGEKVTGNMPNNPPHEIRLNSEEVYTIPLGYHAGTGKIIAPSGRSDTPGTATSNDILDGKTAWVNGEEVIGVIPISDITYVRILEGHQYTLPPGYYPHGVKIYALHGEDILDLDGTDATWRQEILYPYSAAYVDGYVLIVTATPH